ncbi:uncharacterized protein LOC119736257 [Patiria miniata]|uniref:BZIP domain-containing protein n=1 Tax=Patiria miniata TaxID=46514 RepID=A0A914AQA1_PATMI|nr:uncharacterized protein LOC119736257 [Patiria miniata]
MDFMLSGLVVDGQCLNYRSVVLAMEADSTSRRLDKKTKEEIKREKNRESSARSRQRKKDEDEQSMREIARLEEKNANLREIEEGLLAEGRAILEQMDPYYLTQPVCAGCYRKDANETGEGTSAEGQETLPVEMMEGIELPVSNAIDQAQGLQGSSGTIDQAQVLQVSVVSLDQGNIVYIEEQGMPGNIAPMDQEQGL